MYKKKESECFKPLNPFIISCTSLITFLFSPTPAFHINLIITSPPINLAHVFYITRSLPNAFRKSCQCVFFLNIATEPFHVLECVAMVKNRNTLSSKAFG